MSLLLNRAKETISGTPGTGTVTLSGAVAPFQSWAAAQSGSYNTRRYSCLIESGADWEIGEGIFDESANTVTRGLIASSTGSLLNLTSGSPTIACVSKAYDHPVLFDKFVATGSETSFTFSDIPPDFSDFELSGFGENTSAANVAPTIRFNGDSGANYDEQRQYATATTNTASHALGATSHATLWALQGTNVTGPGNTSGYLRMIGYANSAFQKGGYGHWRHPNSNTTGQEYVLHYTTNWRNTAPITSVTVALPSGNFTAGSTFYLRLIP